MNITQRSFETIRDGQTIRGTEYRAGGENLPIAIISHGFMATDQTTCHYARWFAQQGYAAYCFDFIGGSMDGKSDGKLCEMSVLTEKQDLYAVIRYASGQSGNNAGDLTLAGCSQGGFVSALVAAEMKEKVTRLILFYPALCIPDDARKGKMLDFAFDPKNIPDFFTAGELKLGCCYPEAVMQMGPWKEISAYRGPVLILYGLKDDIVALSYMSKAKESYGASAASPSCQRQGMALTKLPMRMPSTP